jgi:acetoin utilization deacetylase AcuC-like enzyme
MTTGIFFSHIFKTSPGPIIGPKFINFPEALGDVLKLPNVRLFEHEPVPEELLLKFHTEEMIESLKKRSYGKNAFYSAGGCIEASKKIMSGELRNALVFNSASGHHAGPTYAWGGTYINCVAPAAYTLRENFGAKKFVLLDTDCHHGDGDREMFKNDPDLLHVCFCDTSYVSETNVCVGVGWHSSDEKYLNLVRKEFIPRAKEFKPEMIFHFLGHDTCQGDYGDIGLTPDFFIELVKEVKKCAEEACQGRYLIITGGGSRRDVAEYIFPKIAEVLASPT